MKISEVRIMVVHDDPRLKAYAIITLDGCFVVRDIKVISGERGLFVAMPSKKTKVGKYLDIAHPINKETRELFEEAILEEYNKAIESGNPEKYEDK